MRFAWKMCEVHFVLCKAQMLYANENKKKPTKKYLKEYDL